MAAPTHWSHVWVGAETGALKGVNLRHQRATNYTSGSALRRGEAARALCWGDPRETELLVGGLDRCVRLFSTEKGQFTGSRLCAGGEGPFCGLATLGSSIVTCVESGLIKVWREDGTEHLSLEVGEGLCRMRQDPARPQRVGTGGRENGLKVWDLQRPEQPLFRAKNVRNDWLDLRVPIWDRDLQFLPGSGRIVTCTAHRQVRLYDPGSPQRRPVLEATFGEGPLTALAVVPGETSVVVGSARGDMAVIDLRKGRVLRSLRGGAGGGAGAPVSPPGAPRGLLRPRPVPAAAPRGGGAPVPQGLPQVPAELPAAEHPTRLGERGGAAPPRGGEGGGGGGRAVGLDGNGSHPPKTGQETEDLGEGRGGDHKLGQKTVILA
uniref:WD repeat domain 74 n=1 Tax=Strigops habroptila TaxID=2489341 RepID=A0A672V9B6_STRHB